MSVIESLIYVYILSALPLWNGNLPFSQFELTLANLAGFLEPFLPNVSRIFAEASPI